MMASSRTALTSSGRISGVGLAKAKTKGLAAIFATISGFKTPPADNPKNTSAPSMTSDNVRCLVSFANGSLSGSISSLRPM